jgi:DNA-binding HxlR family transcriptional regulator
MNTYERKTPEDLNCGLTVFMKVLGAKWKPCIIDAIHQGYKRPSEIHKVLQPATPRVIDMQLSELEQFGLVSKQIYAGFPLHVDYLLTEMGLSILPIITHMDKWGNANAGQVKRINDLRKVNNPVVTADNASYSLMHTE